ncbi:hypothetical protein [Phreatobacter stygius]|uniref:Ribbon-helix-helix protein, CopG family n=1 Tax=Phreatobacter stygius TaxID=1940610 RepID=A0A4D7B3R0_9HYPH|nr:hypothetical protein [Phreatobacter stygius]QCI67521.1 hypothetical protein E8M01_26835 [Phreatobacter stygius]
MTRVTGHPNAPKPKGLKSPAGETIRVAAELDPALIEALDRFIAEDRPGISRAEALRLAFRDWAQDKGLLAPETD